jgi:hypothetical protein
MNNMELKLHAISTHHLGFLIELGHTLVGLIPTRVFFLFISSMDLTRWRQLNYLRLPHST